MSITCLKIIILEQDNVRLELIYNIEYAFRNINE